MSIFKHDEPWDTIDLDQGNHMIEKIQDITEQDKYELASLLCEIFEIPISYLGYDEEMIKKWKKYEFQKKIKLQSLKNKYEKF